MRIWNWEWILRDMKKKKKQQLFRIIVENKRNSYNIIYSMSADLLVTLIILAGLFPMNI